MSILQSISNVNDSGKVIDRQFYHNKISKDRILFGDKDVLSVLESAEPNNILWENLEDSWTER